nr:cysteine-rich receptor-like protein kinase 25 [Ipomoea batatas]GME01086.1 cysteine-rich receptor-like protein kinase 25 [Ipomoea batatas]
MKRAKKSHSDVKETTSGMSEIPTEESVQYDFSTIEAITNCFSPENKIGEGKASQWTRGSGEEAIKGFKTRSRRIQE